MKLLNNFVSLGYAAIYAEALTIAENVGLSAQIFDSVLSGSRMDCLFYQQFMRYALQGDRNTHRFTIANALKDTRYLEAMANGAGVPNPVGNAVKNSFARAAFGGGAEDYVPMLPDWTAGRARPAS
jgi:3-hydroxyisobutyrate dehydrogenase-like beta-hydroxyacid dehydrogenase